MDSDHSEEIRCIIAGSLERDPDALRPEMSLVALGADKNDMRCIRSKLEERFGACFSEDGAVLDEIFERDLNEQVSEDARRAMQGVFGPAAVTAVGAATYAQALELVTVGYLEELFSVVQHGSQIKQEDPRE